MEHCRVDVVLEHCSFDDEMEHCWIGAESLQEINNQPVLQEIDI